MTRIIVKELIWDEYNIEHIKKHNVSQNEVEEAGGKLIYHRKAKKGRYLLIGKSGKRLMTIVLNRIGVGKYYVVTARDASKKERRSAYKYEKENKK